MGNVTAGIIILVIYLAGASIIAALVAPLSVDFQTSIPSLVDYSKNETQLLMGTLCDSNSTMGSFFVMEGEWECNSTTGYTATGTGKNIGIILRSDTVNTTVSNTYHINNPSSQEFKVFIAYAQASSPLGGLSTVEAQVNDDKVWLGYCTGWGLICHTIAESGPMDHTLTDPIEIETYYDYTDPLNQYARATVDNVTLEGTGDWFLSTYFGGVEVVGAGLSLEWVSSTITKYYQATIDVNNPWSVLNYIVMLLAWNPEGFNVWVNIIMFKIPIVALAILGITWIKPIGGY